MSKKQEFRYWCKLNKGIPCIGCMECKKEQKPYEFKEIDISKAKFGYWCKLSKEKTPCIGCMDCLRK